ncbi:MAG: hypothetical protein JWQ39_2924 [Glaciihabitans sp.]|jgi:hypothetical protein|nr:hypothetical protein [Glaciihabitans sp.]
MPESALQDFARKALVEVTPESTIGSFIGSVDNGDAVTTYQFGTTMTGYPGWMWTITVAHLEGESPTIVESELTPAEGALLAPDWVPWSDRMDDYRAAQVAAAEAGEVIEVDGDADDDDDGDEDDDDDDDDFGSDLLHGGDLDGVDIDEVDIDDLDVDELDLLPVQVDEGEQPEAEADSGSENPPAVVRRRKRASKEQQNEQGQ